MRVLVFQIFLNIETISFPEWHMSMKFVTGAAAPNADAAVPNAGAAAPNAGAAAPNARKAQTPSAVGAPTSAAAGAANADDNMCYIPGVEASVQIR